MIFRDQTLRGLTLAAALLPATSAGAQSCRACAIVENQCIYELLDERGADGPTAEAAERAAFSDLVPGCSAGQYQMVLLRGTSVTLAAETRLSQGGPLDTHAVQAACAAAARGQPFKGRNSISLTVRVSAPRGG